MLLLPFSPLITSGNSVYVCVCRLIFFGLQTVVLDFKGKTIDKMTRERVIVIVRVSFRVKERGRGGETCNLITPLLSAADTYIRKSFGRDRVFA